jgi:hypothetical protein
MKLTSYKSCVWSEIIVVGKGFISLEYDCQIFDSSIMRLFFFTLIKNGGIIDRCIDAEVLFANTSQSLCYL